MGTPEDLDGILLLLASVRSDFINAAVVAADLKVHGIEGLRVADASVMPTLIGGNTNAPAIMIGEKASDLLRGRAAPSPANVPVT